MVRNLARRIGCWKELVRYLFNQSSTCLVDVIGNEYIEWLFLAASLGAQPFSEVFLDGPMSGNKLGPVGDWQREDVVEILTLKSSLGKGRWWFHPTQIFKVFLKKWAFVNWSICGFIHAILLLGILWLPSNKWQLLDVCWHIKLECWFGERVDDPRLNLISFLIYAQRKVLVLFQFNFEVGLGTCGHFVKVLLIAL